MIAKLTGLIDSLLENALIVDVGGVGYYVSCSGKTLAQMTGIGDNVSLQIQTIVKEDDFQLYGFASKEEKEWFRLLLTVQGVGARMALALLSCLTTDEITSAIVHQDKTMLTRADGVGPKLAARLMTELKDKVQKMPLGTVAPGGRASHSINKAQSLMGAADQALSALINLGYRRGDAHQAMVEAQKALGDAPIDHYIKHSLSQLARL